MSAREFVTVADLAKIVKRDVSAGKTPPRCRTTRPDSPLARGTWLDSRSGRPETRYQHGDRYAARPGRVPPWPLTANLRPAAFTPSTFPTPRRGRQPATGTAVYACPGPHALLPARCASKTTGQAERSANTPTLSCLTSRQGEPRDGSRLFSENR